MKCGGCGLEKDVTPDGVEVCGALDCVYDSDVYAPLRIGLTVDEALELLVELIVDHAYGRYAGSESVISKYREILQEVWINGESEGYMEGVGK